MTIRHFVRFNIASFAGILIQLAILWLLTSLVGMHYQGATLLAVVGAIVHNFVWHWRWTWADRALTPRAAASAFGRFAMTNGAVSLTVNLLAMPLLIAVGGLSPVPANLLAITSAGLVNFYLADTVAFRSGSSFAARRSELESRLGARWS
jgi:putative flippase GtrA